MVNIPGGRDTHPCQPHPRPLSKREGSPGYLPINGKPSIIFSAGKMKTVHSLG